MGEDGLTKHTIQRNIIYFRLFKKFKIMIYSVIGLHPKILKEQKHILRSKLVKIIGKK